MQKTNVFAMLNIAGHIVGLLVIGILVGFIFLGGMQIAKDYNKKPVIVRK